MSLGNEIGRLLGSAALSAARVNGASRERWEAWHAMPVF